MSADDYDNTYYYNNHEREEYPEVAGQSWSEWSSDPRYLQSYIRTSEQNYENRPPSNYPYHVTALSHPNHQTYPGHPNHSVHENRFDPYHNSTQRQYFRNRYQNPYHQYGTNSAQYGWQRNQPYKRTRQESAEGDQPLKTNKKKKKPLSQNVPTKKDWTIEEAECALATEKAFNKKSKNALIIKFPDHELNKDIVSQFHSAIENVHFQQPCTPRFCFVTLQESADPDEIINVLNKQKFGEGFLTVEYKKDREEDQVILADDIDPLTLYVGNLAQEVTKDDIVNMYPNNKRIDIGFAKKMKFTRYAFIGFRTAAESLEAFKKTHSKQLYSKSLIVRFRRLHGTIGMPGEAKPQNPPKSKDDVVETSTNVDNAQSSADASAVEIIHERVDSPEVNVFTDEIATSSTVQVKQERASSITSDDDDYYKVLFQPPDNRWKDQPQVKIEPPILNVKKEISVPNSDNVPTVKPEESSNTVNVKTEPVDPDDDELDIRNLHHDSDTEEINRVKEEDVDVFADLLNFDTLYENLMTHKRKISMLKQSNR